MTNDTSKEFRWLSLWIGILTLCGQIIGQKRPPNYSQNNMPITSFNCNDKIIGGYYADPETDCQMFHVCVRVPGIGIQNFRFLCPNDTLFDQENQICDDWYNIDCQFFSLYGVNFDLYRLDTNNDVKKLATSNEGTSIPSGPSATTKSPTGHTDKPKKNQYEDDYKRSGNDILRGSHSSNFYANKNHGGDYIGNNLPSMNHQKPNAASHVKNPRTLIRKLTSKRPITRNTIQQSYSTSKSFASPVFVGQPSQNANDRVTKIIPQSQDGDVYFNSFFGKIPKQKLQKGYSSITNPNTIYQRINNLNEIELENSQESVIPVETAKMYEDKFRQSTRTLDKHKIPASEVAYSDSTSTRATRIETVHSPSTDHFRIIAQTYQHPAIIINNQLQDANSKDQQREKVLNPTTKAFFSTYQDEYYQHLPAVGDNQQQTTTKRAQSSLISQNHPKTVIWQPNATFSNSGKDEHHRSSPVTRNMSNRFATSSTISNFYHPIPSANIQHNSYIVAFQTANEKYNENEFLKTAPSSNSKPSDINTIDNGKKQLINATLKAAYSVDQPFRSPSYKYYPQPINVISGIDKSTYATQSATTLSNSDIISRSPKNKVKTARIRTSNSSTPSSGSNLTKSQDYDYAYYDNSNESSEYDQVNAVAEDFVKLRKNL